MPHVPSQRTLPRPKLPVALLTHPFELALGLALVVNGARGLIGDVTPSLAELPWWVRLLYLLVSTTGGAVLSVCLLIPEQPAHLRPLTAPIPARRAWERSALFLVAASYAGLGFAVLVNNPDRGIGTAVVVTIVGGACVLRAVAIRRTTLAVLNALRPRP